MAIMIPPHPPTHGPGAHAEREVFLALRDQLDDDFTVFHDLSYLKTRTAHEGESDFLIVHRELGMLNLEVKGSGVGCNPDGSWYRTEHGRRARMNKTPFEQARRTIHDLVKEIRLRAERLLGALPDPVMPFGYAVAFPTQRTDGFPLEANESITFDSRDLDRIKERVLSAYEFWRGDRSKHEPLPPRSYKQLLRQVITPHLGLVPALAATLDIEKQVLVRVSEQQRMVLEGVLANPRLVVRGCAGSGKTVLAAEAARSFARDGARVLYVCFNRYLAIHMGKVLEGDSTLAGEIKVTSFHRLCRLAATALGKSLDVPEGGKAATAYFNEEAPLFLLEAIAEGAVKPFDAIVVDEGQDFEAEWWGVLEESLRRPGQDPMLVFYDPGQNIFGREAEIPLDGAPVFPLKVNFRNTQKITEAVSQLTDLPMVAHPGCPIGEEPKAVTQRRPTQAAAAIEELVVKLVDHQHIAADQIAILTPHTRQNSVLAGVEKLGEHRLTGDPLARNGVLHTTIGRFKGLESDVVILADVDPDDPRCNRNARYVAASRARHRLYVFEKGNWLVA